MLDTEKQDDQVTTIELVPSSERAHAASRWQDLERRIANTGLTNSWCWIETWLKLFGNVQHIFAFGTKDTQPIGAALITKSVYIYKVGSISIPSVFLGTAGEPREERTYVEYNRLLVAPENLDAFAAGLINTLKQFPWEQLRLHGFVPEHADALIKAGSNIGLKFKVEKRPSPTFDFPKGADEGYRDTISALGSSSTRRSIRQSIRILGIHTVEWAETPEQAKDILKDLIDLHSKRWESIGESGAFRADRVRKYHEDLIDALFPKGSLIVFRVKQGAKQDEERTIGCLFNFVENGHVMNYKSGFALFSDDNRLKPGLVTHVLCMEECRQRGLIEYDFLEGDERYKMQLSNTEKNTLIWASAQRSRRAWAVELARDLYHDPRFKRVENLIKGVKFQEIPQRTLVFARTWLRQKTKI
ncbi:MAG: GNAT family N-acetyltransferase [Ktedonobacteraceae bacterium]